jgi:hypothetical protein
MDKNSTPFWSVSVTELLASLSVTETGITSEEKLLWDKSGIKHTNSCN